MHILIVDDHAFVCAGLKATLLDTLDDIQVTTTERGEEVLSILGNEDIDLIGFHGQTVFHDPKIQISKQLGDGRLLDSSSESR